jgi:hypothetical protein
VYDWPIAEQKRKKKQSKGVIFTPCSDIRANEMRPLSLVCDDQRLRHLDRNLSSKPFPACRARPKLIFHTPLVFSTAKVRRRVGRHSSNAAPSVLHAVLLLRPYDACYLPLLSSVFFFILVLAVSSFHPSSTLAPSFVLRAHPPCLCDVRRRHWPHTLFCHSWPPLTSPSRSRRTSWT